MPYLDLDDLLRDKAADAPCGDNLEYDADYLEFERLVRGRDEVQIGDTILPAEAPDWPAVAEAGAALLARTLDLRIAVSLARAQLEVDGIAGFATALELIARLVAERWEHVHPCAEPDEAGDPTSRVNCLAGLVDRATMLQSLRKAALVDVPAAGRVTLRDLDEAAGTAEAADGEDPATEALIAAAFRAADVGDLQGTSASLQTALRAVAGIEATLTERVGAGQAIDLEPLATQLRQAADVFAERLGQRATDQAAEGVADGAGAAPARPWSVAPAEGIPACAGRADVERAIDSIRAYYLSHEPSSPVPLILSRVRRLVAMDFLELIEELAPDAAAQIRQLGGI